MNRSSTPPRYVPTLTEVVLPGRSDAAPSPAPPQFSQDAYAQPDARLEEQIVQRVMQRVDLVLERRLREALGQLILSHTQSLGPRLREEIELVVRESVSQAVAQELPPHS
jgi:hypothetical protein